ncbi:septal ring lytic transglycosylase RlpA family protein [Kutzneria kofuensis]|uniref:DNA-binding protein H-NS n=1 Tax=Kutzneria kofuensis TaxID=103725 RepID=A0A7W9KK00_9PSEU|nr:septal ring lytic transglycosylase RlpA family protein [Kutzneria kofuensis]MBB5893936.1 DNA-binding protein H-NS [Kutzneria kofuensis]
MSPSRKRAAVLGTAAALGVAVVLGGGFAIISGTSHAANAPTENCQGLDQALQNNLNFIAQQKANPDAQSAARIANRQAVVDQIQQRRQAAGCTNNVTAGDAKKGGSGENCNGLQKALQNNLNFIAQQKAHPDAQSAARIANRQAVVDQIEQRLKAAGCSDNGNGNNNGCPTETAAPPTTTTTTTDNNGGMGMGGNNGMGNGMGSDNNGMGSGNGMGDNNGMGSGNGGMGADNGMGNGNNNGMGHGNNGNMGNGNNNGMGNGNAGCDNGGTDTADPTATADPTDTNGADAGTAANQVCKGSTVTLSGESGTAAASSNQFPVGTKLKVTNLDNNKSITVPVTSTSGSCVLLNNDAFNQIHEQGKQLIRHALIQKVG